jgi:hypothetical protein
MPKVAMDYQKTIIYKIVCNDLNITDTYVGHTTSFIKRKCCHKTRCNNEGDEKYNLKIYTTIRAYGGWDNWAMIQIEEYSCNNLNEATARERYWIETLHSKLNCQVPNRTQKEWYEDNADKLKENARQQYKENADKLKENARQQYKENADKKIEKSKQYNKENADKIKEYKKQYYKENADKIKEKRRQKNKEKKNNNPTDPPLL